MNSKKSFYCWYLGFTEAYGLQGQNRVYEVIQNILKYHQNDTNNNFRQNFNNIVSQSKVTLALSEQNLTIIDNTVVGQKKFFKKPNQVVSKSYVISYDNITYVCRLTNQPYSDIVTFITKSLPNGDSTRNNTGSSMPLFLHAFRCDSDETAIKMERYLTQFLRVYNKKLEKQQSKYKKNSQVLSNRSDFLNEIGHLHNSNLKNSFLNRQAFRANGQSNRISNDNSSGGGTRSSSSNDLLDTTNESGNFNQNTGYTQIQYTSRPTSPLQLDFSNINKELEYKLNSDDPILYPPRDYNHEDRLRGNLKEINSRRSQNPSIIGREAYSKLVTKNSFNEINEEMMTNRSDFTSESFNEQANQVLKLLDDVVNSEISNQPDYDNDFFDYKSPEVKSDSNVYYKNASFRNSNVTNLRNSNISSSMENIYQSKSNPSFFGNMAQKSNSMASGLDDPYFENSRGFIKTNPLLMIEEEPYSAPNPNRMASSMFRSAIDLTSNGMEKSFDSRLSKASNASSNKKHLGPPKSSKSSKFTSRKSNNNENFDDPANVGFRPGVLPILSSYQPQWMNSSAPKQKSEFVYINSQPIGKKPLLNFGKNKQTKLKHSESAKINRNFDQEQVGFRPTSSSKANFFVKKNLTRVNEDKNEYSENTEFILKPNSFVNINNNDYNNNLNNRMRNNASFYKSESSLVNPTNLYNFNDLYY